MDAFFAQDKCGRCGGSLTVRTMSWFNGTTICMDCADRETKAKEHLRDMGRNPAEYEGCGRIPEIVTPIIYGMVKT
jgi:hypothetical protein